ncbi:MAG: TonB-dependent receptor [Rhodothermales bacterium]
MVFSRHLVRWAGPLRCAGCLLVLGAAVASAHAQASDSVYTLPGITVTATRRPVAMDRAPARIQRLDRPDLASAASLADVLLRRAGVFIRPYGNGLATLSMRGGTASQSLILLDGLPVSDPQLGQIDLSLLPLFFVDRVEVMHGAGSSLYGSEAISGAVQLQTAVPVEPLSVSFSGGYGPYGERQAGGTLAARQGRWSARVAGEFRGEDGDYPFWNPSLFPPREAPRAGADRRQHSLYAGLTRAIDTHRQTRIAVLATDAERGLPGPATTTPVGERQQDRQVRLWGTHEGAGWRLRATLQQSELRYLNPRLRIDDLGLSRTALLQAETFGAAGRLAWTAGLSGGAGRAEHPNLASAARRTQGAAFASGTIDAGRLQLYPALRLDAVSSGGDGRYAVNPGLGANLHLTPRAGIALKGRLARGFRAPTLNDRFWQPGGNPDLKPERSWTADAGVAWTPPEQAARLEITVFDQHVRDQIVWQPATSTVWSPQNVAQVRSRGIESSAGAQRRIGRWVVTTDARYTLTAAVDRSDPASASFGRQVRYVPRHQMKATVSALWQARAWNVSLETGAVRIGRRFVTADETQSLAPYAVADAGVTLGRQAAFGRIQLSARLDNAFDAAYESIKGYPMPPRRLHIALRVDLGS